MNTCLHKAVSACARFKKRCRAGKFSNKPRHTATVPAGREAGLINCLPSGPVSRCHAWPFLHAVISKRLTAAIDASASPRKPSVVKRSRSPSETILLVAWGRAHSSTSSFVMPQPLSATRIRLVPPDSISAVMREAPASTALSKNSRKTAQGRSITSPAAILRATSGTSVLTGRNPVSFSLIVCTPVFYSSFSELNKSSSGFSSISVGRFISC